MNSSSNNNNTKSGSGSRSGSHRICRRRASTGELFTNGVSRHQSSPTSVRDTKSINSNSSNSNSTGATSFDEAFKNGTILPYFLDTAVKSFDFDLDFGSDIALCSYSVIISDGSNGLLQSRQVVQQQSSSSLSSSKQQQQQISTRSPPSKRSRYTNTLQLRSQSHSLGDLTIIQHHYQQQHDEIEIQQHSFDYDAAAFDADADVDADENDYNEEKASSSSLYESYYDSSVRSTTTGNNLSPSPQLPLPNSFSFDKDSQQQQQQQDSSQTQRIRHQRLHLPLQRIPLQHYDYEREFNGYQPLALWMMVRNNQY
jgi:hypothetical protein